MSQDAFNAQGEQKQTHKTDGEKQWPGKLSASTPGEECAECSNRREGGDQHIDDPTRLLLKTGSVIDGSYKCQRTCNEQSAVHLVRSAPPNGWPLSCGRR